MRQDTIDNPIANPESNNPVDLGLPQSSSTLTKSLCIKATCIKLPKKDKTGFAYLMTTKDRGTPVVATSSNGFALDLSIVKQAPFNPNVQSSKFHYESWLFRDMDSDDDKATQFDTMLGIFQHSMNDERTIHLYIDMTAFQQGSVSLLNEQEYNSLPNS